MRYIAMLVCWFHAIAAVIRNTYKRTDDWPWVHLKVSHTRMPAAPPAAIKSRSSKSRRSADSGNCANTMRAHKDPKIEPLWIMGPSLPHGKPADTLNSTPQALASNVCGFTTRGKSSPFKRHFTSGIPLPAANGDTKHTKSAAMEANVVHNATCSTRRTATLEPFSIKSLIKPNRSSVRRTIP